MYSYPEINGDRTFIDGEYMFVFKNKLRRVVKLGQIYIVLFEPKQLPFNVVAYDLDGNHLWSINDILKHDYEGSFEDIWEAFEDVYIDMDVLKNLISVRYDYPNSGAWSYYYIDVKEKRLIARKDFRI